jgi:hypothetical protein
MRLLNRIAAVAAGWFILASVVWAQNPPPPPTKPQAKPQTKARQNPPPRVQGAPAASPNQVQSRTVYRPTVYQPPLYGSPEYVNHPGYRSVLRHYPYASSDYTYGFRNPGGVGRFEEYYPPGNTFVNGGRDPVSAMHAGFDQGLPVGSIEQQAMAYNAGTARYSALQQHMDNFARPMGYWGLWGGGVGVF